MVSIITVIRSVIMMMIKIMVVRDFCQCLQCLMRGKIYKIQICKSLFIAEDSQNHYMMLIKVMMVMILTVMELPSNSGWRKGVHGADKFGFVSSLEINFEVLIEIINRKIQHSCLALLSQLLGKSHLFVDEYLRNLNLWFVPLQKLWSKSDYTDGNTHGSWCWWLHCWSLC